MAETAAQRPADLPPSLIVTRAEDALVRVVAGANHVTTLLHTDQTAGAVDAIRVRADTGGGPPPHRHVFGEWFYVEAGTLDITGHEGDSIVTVATLHAGDSAWVPPNIWHGTVNPAEMPARFLVIGLPGIMTSYFDQAGVLVADEQTGPSQNPPGPDQLSKLASDHGIVFFGR